MARHSSAAADRENSFIASRQLNRNRPVVFQAAMHENGAMQMRFVSLLALAAMTAFGQGGFGGPGRYQISNLKSGKFLSADQSGVTQFSLQNNDSQMWEIAPA